MRRNTTKNKALEECSDIEDAERRVRVPCILQLRKLENAFRQRGRPDNALKTYVQVRNYAQNAEKDRMIGKVRRSRADVERNDGIPVL